MDKTAILHISSGNYCYPIGCDTLRVRIRVRRSETEKIILFYKNQYNHSPHFFQVEMPRLLEDQDFTYYESPIQIPEKHFKYYFQIYPNAGEPLYYASDGIVDEPKPENFFYYPAINKDQIWQLPDWAEGESIYQILVDRFFDGDPANNPPIVKPRHALPDRETYYGGDFAGIIQKMEYLKSLGVKIIYLSPIFQSPSYHKYDISDYYAIETIYGGKEGLKQLVKTAHKEGMKIVLDAVFNHCSSEHPFFQDVLSNQTQSPYCSWFRIDSFPVSLEKGNYDNFANEVPTMPKWETTNPEVIEYLTNQAVYWIREADIDGYRFDVADEISHRFWRALHEKIRHEKPEALLIGEIWNHACAWLNAAELDTVTNYKFRQYLLALLEEKITPDRFIHLIQRNKSLYQTPATHYLINLMGSHDTLRLATALNNEKKHYLALSLLYCFEGMPLLYYGDEIGLEGDVDPDNRRAMLWDQPESEAQAMFRHIAKFRSESMILKKGESTFLEGQPTSVQFLRTFDKESILVVANIGTTTLKIDQRQYSYLIGKAHIEKSGYFVPPMSLALFLVNQSNQ